METEGSISTTWKVSSKNTRRKSLETYILESSAVRGIYCP